MHARCVFVLEGHDINLAHDYGRISTHHSRGVPSRAFSKRVCRAKIFHWPIAISMPSRENFCQHFTFPAASSSFSRASLIVCISLSACFQSPVNDELALLAIWFRLFPIAAIWRNNAGSTLAILVNAGPRLRHTLTNAERDKPCSNASCFQRESSSAKQRNSRRTFFEDAHFPILPPASPRSPSNAQAFVRTRGRLAFKMENISCEAWRLCHYFLIFDDFGNAIDARLPSG